MGNRVETPSEGQGFIAKHKKAVAVTVAALGAVGLKIGASGADAGDPLQPVPCGNEGEPNCWNPNGSEMGFYEPTCRTDALKPVDGICVVVDFKQGRTQVTLPFNDFEHSPDK